MCKRNIKIDSETKKFLDIPNSRELIARFYELKGINKEGGENDIRSKEMKCIEEELAEAWGINNPEALEEAMKRVFEHDPDDVIK